MPAFLTHMIAANNALACLENKRVKAIIEANIDAYHSGAQGGDYFYLYKYYSALKGPTYKMFGYALHRARPQRFFVEAAEYIKASGSETLKAFFYGYITHYYLDMLMHPAINAICPDPMHNHNTLEYAIDSMYARQYGVDAMEFNRAEHVRKTHVRGNRGDEISHFFEAMHQSLYYGFKLKKNSYHTTYSYFEKYNRKMHKPSKRQLRWMKLQNKFTLLDLFTMLYYPYEEVKDLFDYEPFYQLIEKALGKAMQLINIVDGYFNDERDISIIESFVYNVNFNGHPVTPREERKPFARMYRRAKLKL